ncbi:MAG: hypothetical protein DRI61_14025 [Chloroflexi bacterium]|nr:MAG: hypothetical protein DRI61_14025 [Chloroflexota bacterium]
MNKMKTSIWDKYADFIYRVATGGRRRKVLLTSIGAPFWFALLTSVILLSLWVDRELGLPRFRASWWSVALGTVLLLGGAYLALWSIWRFHRAKGTPVPFNPPPQLVTDGLYAHIRNPMFLGNYLLLLGLGIILCSLSLIFIFTPLFIGISVFYLKAIEEKELEKKFGEEYRAYKERVPMFIPRLRRKAK